jgi:SP family sugar:H+ symporter-like MFS transporter
MLVLPESPRYKKGDHVAASKSLAKIRRLPQDHEAIVEELAEIQANHEYVLGLGKAAYVECFKGTLCKRLLTGCLLQAPQQLTGVNFIFYYGTQFFKNSGFSNSFTISLITSCVNTGSTLPGLYAIDKLDRRHVLLTGAIGMCISQFIVAILGTTTTSQDSMGNVIVHNVAAQKGATAFICIYIFFFAATWGPSAWQVRDRILSM